MTGFARVGGPGDVDAACRTLALAFEHDPVWGDWAFPDPAGRVERLTAYWRPNLVAALGYGGIRMTDDASVVSLWVPPGGRELDDAGEAAAEAQLPTLVGDRVAAFHEAYRRFEAAHPHDEPHWYLSLLGIDPARRGEGLGMRAVRQHLEEVVDADHVPAYLESSNDANLARYQAAGFEPRGSFSLPDGPTLTTMWRPAR